MTPDEIKVYEEADMNKKIFGIQLGDVLYLNSNRLSNDKLMKPKDDSLDSQTSMFTIRTKKNAYFCGSIHESDAVFFKNTKTLYDNLSLALLPFKLSKATF